VVLLAGSFSQDFIESVRQAADIVRVVGDYVPLKQAGARLKGLCPFHQEKTPSFSVDPNAQLFYCFGCQTGGDLFKFVMLYDKVAFPEAVETLARRFGVPLPARDSGGADPRERYFGLLEAAQRHFRAMLNDERAGKRCRDYLERRGLDEATVDKLGLGYAPDDWEGLRRALLGKRFTAEELQTGGLVLPRKSGQGQYDRFRDRLIFPIRDVRGRICAFGGRTLGDAEPKYINSPETPTYTKGQHLYGLDAARDGIRREGFAVVVEGYLDLAALSRAGIDNVVATLGTAFTPAQVRLLSRYTDRVTVSYDGDAAGAAATARSLDLLLEKGLEIRVVDLPGKTDPDDFIREHGAEAYGQLVRAAPEYLEFLVRRSTRGLDLSRVDQKVEAANAILPHIAKLGNAIERASWASRLADALQIEDGLVMQELRAATSAAQTRIPHRTRPTREPHEAESRLVWELLRSEAERVRLVDEIDWADLEGTRIESIVRTILQMVRQGNAVDYPAVLAGLSNEDDQALLTRIAFGEQPERGPGVDDCLWAFRRKRLARQGKTVVQRLGRVRSGAEGGDPDAASTTADDNDVDRYLLEVQRLARERDALLNGST
jgi:DNA primase